MEARELRMFNAIKRFGQVVYVNEYTFEDVKTNNGSYSPIPLTEEWLEKFGFEWYDNRGTASEGLYSYKIKNIFCSFEDGKFSIQGYLGYSIQYVHQLQNLYFALTNTELTINL